MSAKLVLQMFSFYKLIDSFWFGLIDWGGENLKRNVFFFIFYKKEKWIGEVKHSILTFETKCKTAEFMTGFFCYKENKCMLIRTPKMIEQLNVMLSMETFRGK